MLNKLSCIAVDDDRSFLAVLKAYISKTNFLELAGVFSNPIEAVNFLNHHSVNILYLDIQMPGMTGMEIIETLSTSPQIILISSSDEFAVKAFSQNITDYILKPENSYSRFLKATNRAAHNINKELDDYIFVKIDKRLVRLTIKDINFIEAYGDYVKIHTKKATYIKLSSLRSIQEMLPANEFTKVHRSFIVRLENVDVIEGNLIRFQDKIVPISKQFRDDFFKSIKVAN